MSTPANKNHFTKLGHPIWGIATTEEHVAHEKKIIGNCCIHFNGVMNKQCEAGVTYPKGLYLPCFVDEESPHICPSRTILEGEALEQAARECFEEIAASLRKMEARQTAEQCLDCGQPWARLVQVGPCAYAEPCGHRQGQRKLKGGVQYRTQAL